MTTLTAFVMAKNEEKILDRSLASISKCADEIVYVDTGSDDNSIEIAKKYTDNIFQKVWNNNHAEMYNFAYSKCHSDYFLLWDADFVLRDASESKLLALKEENFGGYDSIVLSWNIEFANDYKTPLKWVHRKLIHKKDHFTFSHPLHPRHIFTKDYPEKIGVYTDIEVDHYNTFGGRQPRYERFLQIMAEIVRKDPNDIESLFYYGEELIFAKDFNTAFDVWNRYLQSSHKDPMNRLVYGVNHFCYVCIQLKKNTEA